MFATYFKVRGVIQVYLLPAGLGVDGMAARQSAAALSRSPPEPQPIGTQGLSWSATKAGPEQGLLSALDCKGGLGRYMGGCRLVGR